MRAIALVPMPRSRKVASDCGLKPKLAATARLPRSRSRMEMSPSSAPCMRANVCMISLS